MIIGIVFAQTLEDVDGLFTGCRTHHHFLETALEGTVFLDGLGILCCRGGTHALYFSTRQSGLEDIGRIQ